MFILSTHASEPIYRQLVDQVRRYVVGGQWAAGFELPSVRQVAADHAINPMTVSKAYSLLELEGLLSRKRGMGMVVAQQNEDTRIQDGAQNETQNQARLALIRPQVQALAQSAIQLKLNKQQVYALIDESFASEPNSTQ